MDTIPQDTPQKQCSKCKKFFPATSVFFTSDKSKKDGFYTKCRECRKQYRDEHREETRLYSLQYAQEHRQEKLEYDRQYCLEHREERREQQREYRNNNRELVNERSRRYAEAHREQRNEYSKRYYREHKGTYLARKKRYHAANKDKGREWARKRRQKVEYQEYTQSYRDTHRELYAEHGKQYRATEHGRTILRAHAHKRRARKLAAPGTLTPQQIQAKLRLQRYRCYYCQKHFEKRNGKYIYHLDHTIPLARPEEHPRHDMSYTVLACPHCNHRKSSKLLHEWPEGGRLF